MNSGRATGVSTQAPSAHHAGTQSQPPSIHGSSQMPLTCLDSAQELARQPLFRDFPGWRKVRAPQDRTPGNAWEAQAYGQCHRKYTAPLASCQRGKGEMVR